MEKFDMSKLNQEQREIVTNWALTRVEKLQLELSKLENRLKNEDERAIVNIASLQSKKFIEFEELLVTL